MSRPAARTKRQPDRALMGIDDLQLRRLADNRKIKLLLGRESLGAVLARFLAYQSGEPDLMREARQDVAGIPSTR